jgi:nucleoside-diphosphate-sugar epimerase
MRRPLCGGLRLVERFLPREGMVAPDDLELGFVHRYATARKAADLLGWIPQFAFHETAQDQARDLYARGLLDGGGGAVP